MVIKTIKEVALERAVECQTEVGSRFKRSIGIVYGYENRDKCIAYGSCIFLEHSGQKYIATAAHVVDEAQAFGFSIVGPAGLVQIAGDFRATAKVEGSRSKDKHDFAFFKPSSDVLEELGEAVTFINSEDVSKNRGTMHGRLYLVLGYPAAKNNKLIDRNGMRLRPQPWSYQGLCTSIEPEMAMRTGLSPDANVAVAFNPKQVGDSDGRVLVPPDPHGVSGGALVDLGIPHPDNLAPDSVCIGRLAGIMIEMHKGERVLAAVRIEHLLQAIDASI